MSGKKILQCHYTLCQVYLFPVEPLCSKVVFHFFIFFWLDFESKNGCGAFIWKLSESLKARRLHQQVCFCVLLVFIDSVLAYGEMHCASPLKTLIHSRQDHLHKIQERLLLMVNDWQLGVTTLQKPPDNSRIRTWNNAIQSWEPSPWKHMLRKGN